ncbi:MAG: aldehyde dehydrogenase family protein, partial [Alphaproteobacteria bacterium]
LAAGNRVIIKPSEETPASAHLLDRMLGSEFDADEVSVVTGDAQVAQALAKMPIDHLVAAGSRPALSAIMAAAATNLTPVTLIPGGKSAALVAPDFPINEAAEKIVTAKLINAGQSCEAPDYALVSTTDEAEFVAAAQAAVQTHWERLEGHPDYAAVPSQNDRKRLQTLIADAIEKGARLVPLGPSSEQFGPEQSKMRPALLLSVTDDMEVLHTEIMGPILPVLGYNHLEDALQFINAGDTAPILSLFTHSPNWRRQVLNHANIGGLIVNDAGPGARPASLPFGTTGRAASGLIGGVSGMMGLTRLTPVFERFRLTVLPRTRPPFTAQDEATINRLVRRGR